MKTFAFMVIAAVLPATAHGQQLHRLIPLRTAGGLAVASTGNYAPGSGGTLVNVAGSMAWTRARGIHGLAFSFMEGAGTVTSANAEAVYALTLGKAWLDVRAGALVGDVDTAGGRVLPTLRASGRLGNVSLSIFASHRFGNATRYRDTVVAGPSGEERVRIAEQSSRPSITNTDLAIGYRHSVGRFIGEVQVGSRMSGAPGARWYNVAAYANIISGLQLGINAGRTPFSWSDTQTRGFFGIAARIDAPWNQGVAPAAPPVVTPLEISTDSITHFVMRDLSAKTVEASGDFSNWEALHFRETSPGNWELRVHLAPALYRVVIRINGGRWMAPPGLVTLPDELGGQNGVFEVRAAGQLFLSRS